MREGEGLCPGGSGVRLAGGAPGAADFFRAEEIGQGQCFLVRGARCHDLPRFFRWN
ncbi:MAG: hypothetical protein LJE94_09015 [Deltaproteobacteria bacterium]|nr:hypothetical protein [Deltaproteobacteria bacterium]